MIKDQIAQTDRRADYSVYLVTDRALLSGRRLADVVAAAVAGGVTVVQIREKDLCARDFVAEALECLAVTRPAGVPLLINDRVDVALAVDADGVHVGQEDVPAGLVRKLIGPDKILGVTAHDRSELERAVADGADYVGSNAVFGTPTKSDIRPPIGPEGLRERYADSPVPVVAIGGIDHRNAAEVIRAGADGVAVVRAIMAASDPEQAARELVEIVRASLAETGRE
ncbi:MAG: thiamine phosphate synthase [Acidobacteriota bacterium]|nr:thiamine phosphate synthase [Acidobacteriota bacterium]